MWEKRKAPAFAGLITSPPRPPTASRKTFLALKSRFRCSCWRCQREEFATGGWQKQASVVKKVAGSPCAKRLTAAGRLPVVKKGCWFCQREAIRGGGRRSRPSRCSKAAGSAARRDSRRRLAQQASVVKKALLVLPARRFCAGGRRSRLPVVKKGCRFCPREEIHGGGWRSRLPVVKRGCRFRLREEIHGGGWRSKLPIVKKEEKDGIALCGDFGGV